ncbi:MAG TPA: hypothetical protein VM534_07545 [Thermoanaerobaculia bacterium]|nr:hypothetical protein [Thermoanaerobaculia bacterium]
MIETEPTTTQFHRYQRPDAIPASEQGSMTDPLLGLLRKSGVREPTVDRVRRLLHGGRGLRSTLLRTGNWARRHPGAAGLALIGGILLARGLSGRNASRREWHW